ARSSPKPPPGLSVPLRPKNDPASKPYSRAHKLPNFVTFPPAKIAFASPCDGTTSAHLPKQRTLERSGSNMVKMLVGLCLFSALSAQAQMPVNSCEFALSDFPARDQNWSSYPEYNGYRAYAELTAPLFGSTYLRVKRE